MTNEEVFSRAYDEVRLRGLSPKTVVSYLGRLKLFLKYFNDQPIEEMNEIQQCFQQRTALHFRCSHGARPQTAPTPGVPGIDEQKRACSFLFQHGQPP